MCGVMLCVEEFSFFHSTPMCKHLQLLHIHSNNYINVSHVVPIRNKLCTRGGGVEGLQQSGSPSNTHSTTTGRNITESTIELSQRKSSDMEN